MSLGLPIVIACTLANAAPAPLTIIVMPFEHDEETSASTAQLAQSVVTAELARDASLVAASTADLHRILELSVDRQLVGCESMDDACDSDVTSALGATHLVTGRLAHLDGLLSISLTLVEAERVSAVARERVRARDFLELSPRLRIGVARLLASARGTAPPPMPPLVVEPRLSDPRALQTAAALGFGSCVAGTLCQAPCVVGTAAITFGWCTPGSCLPASLLSLPAVPPGVALCSAATSAASDVAHGSEISFSRLTIAFLGGGVATAIAIPFVLGLAAALASTADLVPSEVTDPFPQVRPEYAVALALPVLVVGSGVLGTVSASLVSVAFFDEAIVLEEGSSLPSSEDARDRPLADARRAPFERATGLAY